MGGGQGQTSQGSLSGTGMSNGAFEGLPLIGQLLNGDGKNQGAGSTSQFQLQPPGQVPDTSLAAILGQIGRY